MAAKSIGRRNIRLRRRDSVISTVRPSRDVCLELQDHSVFSRSAVEFFELHSSRDPYVQAARLAEQFEAQNRSLFSLLDVSVERVFDGNDFMLHLKSGSMVGAVPLISPTRATPDYGIVVQPRF